MSRARFARFQRGFTLIELLITLVIVAIGMLGLAKLQAAAVAEAGVSRTRSLMTFQAESLAAMMRSNRTYWGTTTGTAPGFTTAFNSATVVPATGSGMTTSATTASCTSPSTCAPGAIAYADASYWATNFNRQFPNGQSAVACTLNAGAPTTCDITLTWREHYVGINRVATTTSSSVNMILHVQP